MKVINLSQNNSVVNEYLAEIRSVDVQKNRKQFRENIERIGQMMAYEISKTLKYSEAKIQTPNAVASVNVIAENLVLATILRAGLPLHQGFLDVFDKAENAFLSAYRFYKDEECEEVGTNIEYIASPDLTDKTLIIVDPMLATGGSLEQSYYAFCKNGTPSNLHLCCVIASKKGVEYIEKVFGDKDNVTLWCAAIDPELNVRAYIVPGLGDAGDLAYGEKL